MELFIILIFLFFFLLWIYLTLNLHYFFFLLKTKIIQNFLLFCVCIYYRNVFCCLYFQGMLLWKWKMILLDNQEKHNFIKFIYSVMIMLGKFFFVFFVYLFLNWCEWFFDWLLCIKKHYRNLKKKKKVLRFRRICWFKRILNL